MQDDEWSDEGLEEPGLPAGVKGLLWIPWARRHKDGRMAVWCNAWVLREEGRLEVVQLDKLFLDDVQLDMLLQRLDLQPGADHLKLQGIGGVRRLPDAPVLPSLLNPTEEEKPDGSAWLKSAGRGWPESYVQAISDFAAKLDAQLLDFLGWVGSQTAFHASAANYNALRSVPALSCQRRMQAILDLPPLVLPLLLSQGEFDMFGFGLCKRPTRPAQVLDAIDQGQDWINALAQHYRVGRACVESDLWRDFWEPDACLQELLWRLDAMPEQARPVSRQALETWLPSLMALPFTASGGKGLDYRVLGQVFAPGWEAVWQSTGVAPEHLPGVLEKVRAFLVAAFGGLDGYAAGKLGSAEAVGLAWLAQHGLASLLAASGRWHALPVTRRFEPEEDDRLGATLQPLLGFYAAEGCSARELMTVTALEQQEVQMRHQVSDQWWDCLDHGVRIMHLSRPGGEQGTAYFCHACAGSSEHGPSFWRLTTLKGHGGAEPSAALSNWALRVQGWINRRENQALREAVLEQCEQHKRRAGWGRRRLFRRLSDPRTRAELQQVVAWAQAHVKGPALSQILAQAQIAGTGYTDAEVFFAQMRPGDALALVREPDNPHDANAIRIEWEGRKLGYVPKDVNADLAQRLDRGEPAQARLTAKGDGATHWVELEFCATLQEP